MLAGLIRAHSPNIALQFSGGRDSLTLLYYLRPFWPLLTVYFCNPGDSFPETLAIVERVRGEVPNFVEVQGRQPEVVAAYGWPTDTLPPLPYPTQRLVDRVVCCYESHMRPLHDRMLASGVTLILRGQRESDYPKSPVLSGQTVGGVTILYPIKDWTTEEVMTYLGDRVPSYYQEGLTSAPDCLHCTGWLNHGAVPYVRKHYPAVAKVVDARLRMIKVLVDPQYAELTRLVG